MFHLHFGFKQLPRFLGCSSYFLFTSTLHVLENVRERRSAGMERLQKKMGEQESIEERLQATCCNRFKKLRRIARRNAVRSQREPRNGERPPKRLYIEAPWFPCFSCFGSSQSLKRRGAVCASALGAQVREILALPRAAFPLHCRTGTRTVS